MSSVRAAFMAALITAVGLADSFPAPAAASEASVKPASRAAEEAIFLRTVDSRRTASLVTGNLTYYAGAHVDYICDVDTIVRSGVILGQCGSEAEPIDLFVRLPTARLRVGDRLRVLGIMEQPATWADVMGHTVYYAFVRAVFVDAQRK